MNSFPTICDDVNASLNRKRSRLVLAPVRRSRGGCDAEMRGGLIRMIAEGNYTHAITLNTNRELTPDNVIRMFGIFCKNMDDRYMKTSHVQRARSCFRFQAIGFIEHPHSRPHLHVAADLSHPWLGHNATERDHEMIAMIWSKITNGAGSTLTEPAYSDGWAGYITKDLPSDAKYSLSTDFHANRNVVRSAQLKDVLEQIAPAQPSLSRTVRDHAISR